MKTYIGNHAIFGKMLYAENGKIKLGVALDFGIRICYLSFKGSKNLFFEQPKNMTDLTTEDGWRVYGGHRLWVAPESEKDYRPDNQPIFYEVIGDKILLSQLEDELLKVNKSIEISFEDENVVKVVNKLQNTDQTTRRFSVWGVTSMAGGGTQYISHRYGTMSYAPLTSIPIWFYTDLADDRAEYSPGKIKLTHRANSKKYKIGVGHPNAPVKYVNQGVCFEKIFDVFLDKQYPDHNVSYETFMCDHMVEIESLSPLYDVAPNQTISHTELWRLTEKE